MMKRQPTKRAQLLALLGGIVVTSSVSALADVYSNPYATQGIEKSGRLPGSGNLMNAPAPETAGKVGEVRVNASAIAPVKPKPSLQKQRITQPTPQANQVQQASQSPQTSRPTPARKVARPKRLPLVKSSPAARTAIATPAATKRAHDVVDVVPQASPTPETAREMTPGLVAAPVSTPLRKSYAKQKYDAQRVSRAQPQIPARSTWLPSTTSTSCQQESLRLLSKAMDEYKRHAWASAENSAWESLRHAAEGIDIAERNASFGINRGTATATNDLRLAREAIREARDFSGKYGELDVEAMERLVLSHTTTILKGQSLRNVPPSDAIDRYLDEARERLARLATYRAEAAQCIDLIAAICLGRGDAKRLPNQTALCLRRAALQGQPQNGDLAERLGMHLAASGLDAEAKWALEHAMKIQPSADAQQALIAVQHRAGAREAAFRTAARIRSRLPAGFDHQRGSAPEVVQLTPAQFANISTSVIPEPASGNGRPIPVGYKGDHVMEPLDPTVVPSGYIKDPRTKKSPGIKDRVGRVIDTVKFWE